MTLAKNPLLLVIITVLTCNLDSLAQVDLGPDKKLCFGTSVILDASSEGNYGSFLWSTGETTPTIEVSKSGTYTVEMSHITTFTDTVLVDFDYDHCNCSPFIPNAFTPNNDGHNDLFKPIINCTAVNYEFNIYNRWGELVFKTHNLDSAWDGSYLSQKVDAGLYGYQIKFIDRKNEKQEIYGTVNVLR
jgi:gliding motility-associated-like protein